MLDWLENPSLRRRCQARLNKSEQRDALTGHYSFRQGQIIDRSPDAIAHLRLGGEAVPDDLLAHTSPVGWEHIAFSGDFLWDRPAKSDQSESAQFVG